VDDWAAERSFGGVVGRLDAIDGDDRPERWPDLEQVIGETVGASGCVLRLMS